MATLYWEKICISFTAYEKKYLQLRKSKKQGLYFKEVGL